jgi:uroporphyrinogen-III synthase
MNAQHDLSGLTVLLTRPQAQSLTLATAIRDMGGEVCELPLIEIEPVTDGEPLERIKATVQDLDRYEVVIFISTNAARLGMEWIDRYWPQLPAGLSAYAVGPGTAKLLEAFDWPVYCPDKGVTSEDLLALPGLREVSGMHVLLCRGVGGRELIAETLRERGAHVDYLELYHRHTPDYSQDRLAALMAEKKVNAVVVTSAQILDVLLHSLHNDPAPMRSVPVLVPSERVCQRALDAGLSRVINAGGADDKTLLNSLGDIAPTMR